MGTYQRSLCCRFAATGRPFRPRDRRAARQGTGCCDDHDLQLAHQRRPTGSHVCSAPSAFFKSIYEPDDPTRRARRYERGGRSQIVDRSRFRSLAGILLPAVATTASAPKQCWRDVVARPAGPATMDTTRNQLTGASGNVTATLSARWAFPGRAVGQATHRIAGNWQPVTPRGDGDHSTNDQAWSGPAHRTTAPLDGSTPSPYGVGEIAVTSSGASSPTPSTSVCLGIGVSDVRIFTRRRRATLPAVSLAIRHSGYSCVGPHPRGARIRKSRRSGRVALRVERRSASSL